MKKLLLIPFALLLAGCDTDPQLIRTQLKLIQPDSSMFKCPILTKFPDPDKLTDRQVAELVVTLYKNNKTCRTSIYAIKKFLDSANSSISQ